MVILCENYNHKLFGFIQAEEADFRGKTMDSSSPEPKGTLTPPGSSPLGVECAHIPHFTQSSTPASPETPMTPDSAHMTVEPLLANQSESFGSESTNQKPLIGAQKRKAAKVHKLEPECASVAEGETRPPSRLTCSVCQATMVTQHDFTRHIRTHNRVIEDDSRGAKLFECGLCQKQLSSNSSLDRHMLVHSGERPFRCHICGTHFTTNGNMHRHIRGHFRNGGAGGGSDSGDSDGGSEGGAIPSPRKRGCPEFDDDGPPGKIVRLHNESYSADDEVSLPDEEVSCPVCGVELDGGVTALETHLDEDHPDYNLSRRSIPPRRISSPRADTPANLPSRNTSLPFPSQEREDRPTGGFGGAHRCPTCTLSFASVEEWLIHLRDHPTLKCSLCDATFDSISEYTSHQQRHSQEASERLPFFDRSQTSSASSIFTRGLPFGVTPQQIPFPSHDPLKRGILPTSTHLSLVRHPPTPLHSPSPIPLSLPLPHTAPSTLSHDEQFARDYRDMKLNGQYPCRLCKEVFANLRKLKSHNLVHMIAPPYHCNLCSFVSNDKNTLKEHMKNHKGDTPYECNLCSLSFTTKANCERHIKNIHGRQTRDEVKRCMTYTPQEDGPPVQEPSRDTVCRLCNFDCKSRSVLRDHMRSLHPEGVDKPFSCKICQVGFQSSSDAFRHIIQAHQDAVSRESLQTLVEQRSQRDEVQQDLSSVESLLTISNLPLPITSSSSLGHCSNSNSSKPSIRPTPSQMVPLPTISSGTSLTLTKVPTTFPSQTTIVSPSLPIPAYTPPEAPCDEAPLDLSMNKRNKDDDADEKGETHKDASDDEEITVIDEDDKNKTLFAQELKGSDSDVIEIKPTPNSIPLPHRSPPSDGKAPFPLMYPGQLPVQFLPFQGQYPFLMNPFGPLPPVTNLQILEQYQQEIKRGLQLTSGGSLLNSESSSTSLIPSVCNNLLNSSNNHFMKTGTSSFQLSAMALAASQNDQASMEESSNAECRSQNMPTDLSSSVRDNEEMSHFTMRNSVLVKKPKQRRYRTERPWRCDLCDKGFTLRSNMERHMKQQHPDLWQQRPRGAPSSHRVGSTPGVARDLFRQTGIDSSKSELKSDAEEVTSETTDGGKEDDENELIIDDEEDEDDEEALENHIREEAKRTKKEESAADLVSVQKLLSTASSQSFSFFHKESDDGDKMDDQHSSPSLSPVSQDTSSEEGKKSAYSSAPQKQKCPFCHRKFPWSSSLVRHIRTHTGQKPYLCPVCHFPFTTKSNCDRHLQRKHPDSSHAVAGDRPYRCSKCPSAAFTSIESLRKHDMFKHERANDASLIKEDFKIFGTKAFWCYLCDARCYSSKEMLHHVGEAHPENFRSLRLEDGAFSLPSSPTTRENNNETSSDSASEPPSSNGSDMVICMLCYKKASTVEELKDHILSHHTYNPSNPPFSPDSCPLTEEERKAERLEEEEDEEERNDDMKEEEEEEEEECEGEKQHEEDKKDEKGEEEEEETEQEKTTTDFISNMLGTKPAVIDHLLSSKSTVDAAKLLGVR